MKGVTTVSGCFYAATLTQCNAEYHNCVHTQLTYICVMFNFSPAGNTFIKLRFHLFLYLPTKETSMCINFKKYSNFQVLCTGVKRQKDFIFKEYRNTFSSNLECSQKLITFLSSV